jgi:hypothetical protein
MAYMRRSLGGSCSGSMWTVAMSWSRRSFGVVRLLCSDMLSVKLCRPGLISTRCTFSRLLGGEVGRFEGLMRSPKSPRAPNACGGICLLALRSVCDPVGGVVDRAAPMGQHQGAP